MQRDPRMKRELKLLAEDPPHGVSCWAVDDKLDHLEASKFMSASQPNSTYFITPSELLATK